MLSMCESLGASVAIRFNEHGAALLVEPKFRATHVSDSLAVCYVHLSHAVHLQNHTAQHAVMP